MSSHLQQFTRIIGLALILIGSGCSLDKSLTIDSGTYLVIDPGGARQYSPGPMIQGLAVDKQDQLITIDLRKGEPRQIRYTTRTEEDWPTGCPGNLYSHRMEIFDLQVDAETAMILGVSNPVLIRNCPEAPYQLVLREDKDMDMESSLTACPYPADCLFFIQSQAVEDCPDQNLELLVEELDREKSSLESWTAGLVNGYGPGIWYFSMYERPLFHHTPETVNLEGIVEELNQLFAEDQIPTIQVEGQSGATVVVSVSDDQLLTQGMGSTGAQGYLQVVLYSLASLPEIDCVDFQFQEGDHAQPGIICRPG